jgi:hypothetical protein
MGRNFKLVVIKGISAAAQIEATTEQSQKPRPGVRSSREASINHLHGHFVSKDSVQGAVGDSHSTRPSSAKVPSSRRISS